jgi:diguanylate cyclase (GGDEF)-like protein/PAS domain S-box-containing protein
LNRLLAYSWSDFSKLTGLAFIYALSVKIALAYLTTATHISVLWIPSGIGLAALLLLGERYWLGLLAGSLLMRLLVGHSLLTSLFGALSSCIEPLAAIWLLQQIPRRISPFNRDLLYASDYLSLAIVAAIAAMLAAGIGSIPLISVLSFHDWLIKNLYWWLGNSLGMILITPLILVWRQFPTEWFKGKRVIESIILFGLTFLTGQIVFLGWAAAVFGHFAQDFLLFFFVVWAGIRFSRHQTLLITSMIAVQGLIGIIHRHGYFISNIPKVDLLNFWVFMMELVSIGITLTLIVNEREQIENSLRSREAEIHTIFDNAPVGIWLMGLDGRYRFVNKTFCDAVGIPEIKFLQTSNVAELLGAEAAGNCFKSDHDCLAEKKPHLSHEAVTFVDGKQHLLEITKTKLKDQSGNVSGIIGTAIDVTERMLAEQELRRSELLLRSAQESAQLGYCVIDLSLGCWESSSLLNQIFGINASLKRDCAAWSNLIHPDDRQAVLNQYQQAIAKREKFKAEYKIVRLCDGKVRWVAAFGHIETNNEGMAVRLMVAIQDISDRKKIEEEMQLAALVYQNSSEAMTVTGADGTIISVNPAFTQMTGYSPEDVIGQDPKILSSGLHDQTFYQMMWHQINTDGCWQGEIWNRRKNGQIYAEWLSINTIFNGDGSVHRRVALFSDITQKKEAEQLIWKQANFDHLTELPNRRMFQTRLEQAIEKNHHARLSLALLFIDLDRFKEVNDTLGHDMGDLLLKEAALRLNSCLGEADILARLGGDEFTIILSDLKSLEKADQVAQAILQKLATPFQLLEDEIAYISASIGIAVYPNDGVETGVLIKSADQAMYASKNEGRNRYNYFTPAMQEAAQKRRRLANDLRIAIIENQFTMAYQPIVELATQVISKAEALIRWEHPKCGVISPADFIHIAEETGMIVEIGNWVFEQVAQQLVHWRKHYHAVFQISINKSPVQFHSEKNTHKTWVSHLKSLGLPGQSIVVEITEGLLMDVSDILIKQLLEFRDAGIQVSLDDFGTGYSSLSYLRKFDIDYLKIDQSFVRNLVADSDDLALCEAIIVMAHKLGIKVIAEGIETDEQCQLLAAAGCDYGQGYLFSKPISAQEFEKLLVSYNVKSSNSMTDIHIG